MNNCSRIGKVVAVVWTVAFAAWEPAHAQNSGVLVGTPAGFRPQTGKQAIEKFQARVPSLYEGGECRVRDDAPMAARIITVGYPTIRTAYTSASVWINQANEAIRYSENTTTGPRSHANLDSLIAMQARAPTTSIQLDIKANRALAANRGGEYAAEGVTGTLDEFFESGPFRHLRQRMEEVIRMCVAK